MAKLTAYSTSAKRDQKLMKGSGQDETYPLLNTPSVTHHDTGQEKTYAPLNNRNTTSETFHEHRTGRNLHPVQLPQHAIRK